VVCLHRKSAWSLYKYVSRIQNQCACVYVSYNSDAPLDLKIKSNMVSDLFSLVGMLQFLYFLIALFIKQTETNCIQDRQACAVIEVTF